MFLRSRKSKGDQDSLLDLQNSVSRKPQPIVQMQSVQKTKAPNPSTTDVYMRQEQYTQAEIDAWNQQQMQQHYTQAEIDAYNESWLKQGYTQQDIDSWNSVSRN